MSKRNNAIALYQLAPWRVPRTEEQEIRVNGTEARKKLRTERRNKKAAEKGRLRGRLIHTSRVPIKEGSKVLVGVTWHGYDAWLREQGVRPS